MKVNTTNTYDADIAFPISINEIIKKETSRLVLFLKYLKTKHPKKLPAILSELNQLLLVETIRKFNSDITNVLTERSENMASIEMALKVLLSRLCNKTDYLHSLNQKQDIIVYDWLNSWLYIEYIKLKSLYRVMDKNIALAEYKDLVDYASLKTKKQNSMPDIDHYIAPFPKSSCFDGGFNSINFKVSLGKVGCLITKCKWAEVVKCFAQPEEAYAICCHCDFLTTKISNENFLLTRTSTLTLSSPCDFCWHDLRESNGLHPDRRFWQSF